LAYQQRGQDWSNEVNILRQLFHGPHIVQMVNVFCQPQADHTYLVMPQLQGGDLLDKLDERGCFSELEAASIGQSLLQALQFCHARGIAHLDVKPENILLVTKDNNTNVQLADWGCAKQSFTGMATTTMSGYGFCKTLVGTPLYCPPEVLTSSWLLSCCQPIEIEQDNDDDSLFNLSMEFLDSGIAPSMN
jgi:serine/threonine protein kinase